MSTSGPIKYDKKKRLYQFATNRVLKTIGKDLVLVSSCNIIHCEQCAKYLGVIRGSTVTMCRAYTKLVMFNEDNKSIKFEVN